MKKRIIIVLIFTIIMALLLCGCGSKKSEDTSVSVLPAAPTPSAAVTASPAPSTTPEPTFTPAPTEEPISVQILCDGQPVTSLTKLSTSVLQLIGSASDGSIGGFWSSGDASIASVDANGVVSCWKTGTTNINYEIEGKGTASVSLSVSEPVITVFLNGAIAPSDISMRNEWGMELTFVADVDPEGEVAWSSDDEGVASVDTNGKATAHHIGTTTIHCKCGTAKKDIILRVLENPYNNYIEPTPDPNAQKEPRIAICFSGVENNDFTITEGTSISMACLGKNLDINGQTVTWSIDDESIATVTQQGVVTGVGTGKNGHNWATITVTCGDYTDTSIVRVVKPKG